MALKKGLMENELNQMDKTDMDPYQIPVEFLSLLSTKTKIQRVLRSNIDLIYMKLKTYTT